MTILPAAYLGSVEYFAHLLCDDCVIDLGEHFVKRSERNRAQILASGGVMDLTVHVRHANRPRTPMRDVRLDKKRTRRFMPSPISRSFPTGCLSRLICQSQTCCLLRVPTRRSY